MAKSTITKSTLGLKYQVGTDDNGNPKFATQKYSKIKVGASDDAILAVGKALSSLLFTEGALILKEQDFIVDESEQA
ncbi:MAG: DUF1659 domain-containing protein [Sarcina sp.]